LISAQKTAVLEEHQPRMNSSDARELGEVVDVRRDEDAILLQSAREEVGVGRA
jgi:hypothetical protein